jgi:hypothetical protein
VNTAHLIAEDTALESLPFGVDDYQEKSATVNSEIA